MLLIGKVSSKGQVTFPKEVRDRLGIKSGDELTFLIEGSSVRVEKARPFDLAWHRGIDVMTAPEWGSPEDEETFRDLQSGRDR